MRIRLFLATILVSLVGIFVGPLAAHSEVFERAPASGQVVSGVVDHVDISFWTSVDSSAISLIGPGGEFFDVGATTLLSNGRIATVDFAALTIAGKYAVSHTEVSEDGDSQTAVYEFIYHETDGDPLGSLFARETGPNWLLLGGIAGVVLVLGGLFWPGRSSKSE